MSNMSDFDTFAWRRLLADPPEQAAAMGLEQLREEAMKLAPVRFEGEPVQFRYHLLDR